MKRLPILFTVILLGALALSQFGTSAEPGAIVQRFEGAAAKGPSGAYPFDTAHSFIGFRVGHNGLIDVPGYFRDFTGTAHYNAEEPEKSSVEFKARATSIDTGVGRRDDHLRSKDFFEVEKYPDLTFKSTRVERRGDAWMMTGDLTIKGVTRPVSFPFNITGFLPPNERTGARMGITAETTINRRDFGITYGSDLPGGIPVIGNDVKVVLAIEAVMKKEEPPAPKPAG